MRWFLTFWMVFLFLNGITVQARDSGGPRLVLEEQVHDSGRVREGRMIGHTFRILNKGDQPLRIKKVKPG